MNWRAYRVWQFLCGLVCTLIGHRVLFESRGWRFCRRCGARLPPA